MPGASDNPEGFYESIELFNLNNSLLESVGHRWDSPWIVTPRVEHVMGRIEQKTIDTFLGSHPISGDNTWIDKDPNLCLTIDFINRILNVTLPSLGIIRNPLAAAHSLRQRNGLSLEHALGMWIIYNYHAFIGNASLPVAILSFENLISGSLDAAEKLARFTQAYCIKSNQKTEDKMKVDTRTQVVMKTLKARTKTHLVHQDGASEVWSDNELAMRALDLWNAIKNTSQSSYYPTAEIQTKGALAMCAVIKCSSRILQVPFYSFNLELAKRLEVSHGESRRLETSINESSIQWEADRDRMTSEVIGLKQNIQTLRAEYSYAQGQLTESVDIIRRLQEELLEHGIQKQSLRQRLADEVAQRQEVANLLTKKGIEMQLISNKLDWNRKALKMMRIILAKSEKTTKDLQLLFARTFQERAMPRKLLMSDSVFVNGNKPSARS
ncbi:hypothetical protein KBY96_15180 [Cyanobium sp. ATX 6A2]|uniref:hypothetical protein n=1 Tax=Cyanobium sp. ATX 6A2 TaxID=2823700 RepID=UPI0020CD2E08|nr:hypothetical protein [Cyanobium sp. ATX 6A2]MCP9889263.1 hypothetical protein [Cyanobium sp. ATX 6A2]